MIPHMKPNDLILFYKYLDKCTNYFEFGSGGSTFQASLKPNIKHLYSVESDYDWYSRINDKLNENIRQNNNQTILTYRYIEMKTLPRTWGSPGPSSKLNDWKLYSGAISDSQIKINFDLVLIDGRFRVACCLKCWAIIDSNCFVIFDDFFDRPYYHVCLDYFDVVEKTSDNVMAILKKKSIGPTKELIEEYEKISR